MKRSQLAAIGVFAFVSISGAALADVAPPPNGCAQGNAMDGGACTIDNSGGGFYVDGGPGICGPGTCTNRYPGPFYSDGGAPLDAGISCVAVEYCFQSTACLTCNPVGTGSTSSTRSSTTGNSGATTSAGSTGATTGMSGYCPAGPCGASCVGNAECCSGTCYYLDGPCMGCPPGMPLTSGSTGSTTTSTSGTSGGNADAGSSGKGGCSGSTSAFAPWLLALIVPVLVRRRARS